MKQSAMTDRFAEYPVYSRLSLQEGLAEFAGRTLLPLADWVRSWRENRDPEIGLVLGYEQMLSDTAAVMTRVAEHFERARTVSFA